MTSLRFFAIKESLNRKPFIISEDIRRSELFGANVFSQSIMRHALTKEAYHQCY